MRRSMRFALGLGAAVLMAPSVVSAHFTLLAPASWLVENRLGDPQKAGPCGGTSADAGTPTNAIGKVQGGSTLHVKVQETVFHPGHYRIALAVNSRAELPPDPDVTTRDTDRGPWSVSAKIQNPAQPLLEHLVLNPRGLLCEVEIDHLVRTAAHAIPLLADIENLPRRNIARHKVAVRRIFLFEEIETLFFRNRRR